LTLHASTHTAAWDLLVGGHPNGTPFHLSGFLTAVGGAYGLQVHLAVAEIDGEVVGAVPLLVRVREPFVLVNHRLPIPYLGPLLPPECGLDAVVPAVRRYLRPRQLLHLGVKSVAPLTPPRQPGWESMDGYVKAVIPVADRDDDALLGQFTSSQRTAVRRALRNGLETAAATRQEIADHLTDWANAPFIRQGLPPQWPAGLHLAVFDQLAAAGAALPTAVRRDGELVALALDLRTGENLIGWEMGMSPEGRAAGAASLICLAGLRRARELGCAGYDVLGAPNAGIADYKRSLGAEFQPCGVARWASPLLPWGKRLIGLAGRVPAEATR
jgi:CelD/BcsL family acetyltransferase involved in cellulose biosynthesis